MQKFNSFNEMAVAYGTEPNLVSQMSSFNPTTQNAVILESNGTEVPRLSSGGLDVPEHLRETARQVEQAERIYRQKTDKLQVKIQSLEAQLKKIPQTESVGFTDFDRNQREIKQAQLTDDLADTKKELKDSILKQRNAFNDFTDAVQKDPEFAKTGRIIKSDPDIKDF